MSAAAPAASRETRGGSLPLTLFSAFIYFFLYAPILVLVVFSFNSGRLTAEWQGFTFHWYAKLLQNPQILSALRNSLVVAGACTVACTTAADCVGWIGSFPVS